MVSAFAWIAVITTVLAALITAANLGSRITGYGFCVFLVGSLAWLANGIATGDSAVVWDNAILTVLNVFGIWRWLGRQSKVEAGAAAAAEASVEEPGENLFPVALLTRAKVHAADAPHGHCVDAMAGDRSGRIRYVVVSDGGIASVGETLHRVDWSAVAINGEEVRLSHSTDELERQPVLQRDQWPAR